MTTITTMWNKAQDLRSSKWAVLAVVSLAIFSDMLIYGVVVPILPTLLRKIGYPENEIEDSVGFLFGVYAVGLVIASPIFGFFSDKYNSRMMPMLVGLICLGVSTLLFAWSTSLIGLFLARTAQGMFAYPCCLDLWLMGV
jgi:MFS family permease